MWYPPFCEMVNITFSGGSENQVANCAKLFRKYLEPIKNLPQRVQILGPIPAALSKINNKFRWRILIKCIESDKLNTYFADARDKISKNVNYKDITIAIDKNPNNAY